MSQADRPAISRLLAAGAMAVLALCGVSCARYQAQPITAERIDAALRPPTDAALTVAAMELHHPLLPPVNVDPGRGLTPDGAAVIAVLVNPSLRALRDERAEAAAQVLQAGILPNPQLNYSSDFVTGGNIQDTFNAYGLGLTWDLKSLITRGAAVSAARRNGQAIMLDVAWREWQIAEGAKLAAYDLLALQRQAAQAKEIAGSLAKEADIVGTAVEQHHRTVVDLSAAQVASQDAAAIVLGIQQQVEQQKLTLRRALGLPPDAQVRLRPDLQLPVHLDTPPEATLLADLPARRLDLAALRRGYASQEEVVRHAVMAQFPDISVGFNRASDTSNVHTLGFGVTVDLPIFDRNQGVIATERATRQRLFDELVNRIHEARSDVAMAQANVRSLNAQIAQAQGALPGLRHLVEVYRQAYDLRDVDALTFSAAQRQLFQRELDLLKLQQQLLDNKVALELAAGVFLPDVTESITTRPSATVPAAGLPVATAPAGSQPATEVRP